MINDTICKMFVRTCELQNIHKVFNTNSIIDEAMKSQLHAMLQNPTNEIEAKTSRQRQQCGAL